MPSCSQSASPMLSRSSSQRCCASPNATTWLFQNVFAASQARRSCDEQRALAQEAARQRFAALRQRGIEPALDAFRRDRRRRIDAHPAAALEPDLRPGVRVRLADEQIAADRVVLAALIAGDDARRNAGGARQHRERRGEVLAEAAARVEQEVVDGVELQPRRLERVEVFLVAKLGEHRCDERLVAAGALAHLAGERDRARVAAAGQSQCRPRA